MENKELKERFIDERTGIEYSLVGDYYIPNITIPNARRTGNIGKYGRLKLNYMKKHKIPEYTEMLLSNELKSYVASILCEIDELQQENKQLKDNWNKLKEYCKENTLCYEVGDDENTKLIGSKIHGLNVLDKMQELEQGSDK